MRNFAGLPPSYHPERHAPIPLNFGPPVSIPHKKAPRGSSL